MAKFYQSSIGRKYLMALSAMFLLFFLLQHFLINFTSVFSEARFNEISDFFGNNILIQFILQPILMAAVIFHLVMGIVLDLKNRKAKPKKYAVNSASASSSWVSRNMIWTGLVILAFLALHLYDFFFPEMQYKYVCKYPNDPNRYYGELVHRFENPFRVGLYVLSFIFLGMHLWHGFQSSFQSIGARHGKYTPTIVKLGKLYAILIPLGFIVIALYHYINIHL